MILNAFMHNRIRHAETWPEMTQLITEVVENAQDSERRPELQEAPRRVLEVLESLPKPSWPDGGVTSAFVLAELCMHMDDRPLRFDNYLQITVNAATGYGALMWFVTEGSSVPVAPDVAEHVWISDNPRPPTFDPHVFSDPGFPRFHHPRSTLPVAQVRAALEEFCRTGTGQRPECIDWTPGQLSGQRLDMPEPDEEIEWDHPYEPTA